MEGLRHDRSRNQFVIESSPGRTGSSSEADLSFVIPVNLIFSLFNMIKFIFLLLSVQQISTEFSPDFRAFIHNNFGVGIVTQLERRDLGADASFGGKISDEETLTHQAVIIVHGITNKVTRFNASSSILNTSAFRLQSPKNDSKITLYK